MKKSCGNCKFYNYSVGCRVDFVTCLSENNSYLFWKPVEEKQESKAQLTEDEVKIILDNQWPDNNKEIKMEEKIKRLKEKGLIKLTAMEEARKYYDRCMMGMIPNGYVQMLTSEFIELKRLYEKAIEEKYS